MSDIYHVETRDDFLFFRANSKQDIIAYCNKNKLKINAINLFPEDKYQDLLFVGFIKEAISI
jgi:hypothetical protein